MAVNIRRDVDLSEYNTYCLPGRAAFLALARTQDDVVEACRFASRSELPTAVLGSGSNVIVDEKGYSGVVIVNRIPGLERLPGDRVRVGAGELLSNLVAFTAREGLAGLGGLAGIPGTVGGAIYGNAGAFGVQIGDRVAVVHYVGADCRPHTVTREECRFSYRDSAFKRGEVRAVMTSAELRLDTAPPEEIRSVIDTTLASREGKHPRGASCGSYFKNIEADRLDPEARRRLSDWIVYNRIAAGKLIQEAGLKGYRVGGAVISEQHSNFLLNDGTATASDLKELARFVRERVRERFGVELEEEVRYL